MRISELDIHKEEDRLDREDSLLTIHQFLMNTTGPYVLALDAGWGVGKTTFIKLLQNRSGEDYYSISINAWEHDFIDEPLVNIISEMSLRLTQDFPKVENDVKALKEKLIQFSKVFVADSVKSISGGFLDPENISEKLKSSSEELLDEYASRREAMDEMKSILSKISIQVEGNKIVVFVDELDRCRPDYAVEFLERMKHIFDLKGFIFVLAIEKVQLQESMKAIYGGNFDSNKYLRRFIDFTYTLEPNITEEYILNVFHRLNLPESLKKVSTYKGQKEQLLPIFKYLSTQFNLSARDVNQISSRFFLTISLLSQDEKVHLELLLLFIILKHTREDVYEKYIVGKLSSEKLIEVLGLDKIDSKKGRTDVEMNAQIQALIISATHPKAEGPNDLLSKLVEDIKVGNVKTKEQSSKIWHYYHGFYKKYITTDLVYHTKKVMDKAASFK
jgi:hypothetical protein